MYTEKRSARAPRASKAPAPMDDVPKIKKMIRRAITTPAATSAADTAGTTSAPAAPGTAAPVTSAATAQDGLPEWRLISVSAGRGRKGQRLALLTEIYWTTATKARASAQRARVREWHHAPFDGPDSHLSERGKTIPAAKLLGARPLPDDRRLIAAKPVYQRELDAKAAKERLKAEAEARAATRTEFPPRTEARA